MCTATTSGTARIAAAGRRAARRSAGIVGFECWKRSRPWFAIGPDSRGGNCDATGPCLACAQSLMVRCGLSHRESEHMPVGVPRRGLHRDHILPRGIAIHVKHALQAFRHNVSIRLEVHDFSRQHGSSAVGLAGDAALANASRFPRT